MNIADALMGKDAAVAVKASGERPDARLHRMSDDAPKRKAEREAWHDKQPAPKRVSTPFVATPATTTHEEHCCVTCGAVLSPDSLPPEVDPTGAIITLLASLPPAGPMPEKKLFALTTALSAMLEFFYGAAG